MNLPLNRDQVFELERSAWTVSMLLNNKKEIEAELRVRIKELVLMQINPQGVIDEFGGTYTDVMVRINQLYSIIEEMCDEILSEKL